MIETITVYLQYRSVQIILVMVAVWLHYLIVEVIAENKINKKLKEDFDMLNRQRAWIVSEYERQQEKCKALVDVLTKSQNKANALAQNGFKQLELAKRLESEAKSKVEKIVEKCRILQNDLNNCRQKSKKNSKRLALANEKTGR